MIICKTKTSLQKAIHALKKEGIKTGFVPTMGALHKGHISLVEASKKADELTVASIFINPTQFNNAGDLAKYPKTLEKDIAMLEEAGCDILFMPDDKEMYPGGQVADHYNLGPVEELLEGAFRPGHYQGVATIVDRLLQAVQPDHLYLGQKDYQQCMVINKMIGLKGHKTKIVICPTEREPGGLAMSSRNMRLTEEQKKKALAISRELFNIKNNINSVPIHDLQEQAFERLQQEGFKVDYVKIADATDLQPATTPDRKLVALIAATIGDIRLIDNMLLN